MKKLLLFVLLIWIKQVDAQVCFGTAASYTAGAYPRSICAGDFNGDGKRDLAISNYVSNDVSVFLGTGSGSFGTATNYNVGGTPDQVITADLNGDGLLDLATINEGPDSISVLINSGSGSFSPAVNYDIGAIGYNAQSLTFGDFNGDGKFDLAAANAANADISVLLNTGSGSFGPATLFYVGGNSYSIISADINKDGNIDLAVTTNSGLGTIAILLGIGNGSFNAPTHFPVATSFCNPRGLNTADFNGDSKLDLVSTNGSNTISVLLGLGGGSFGTVSYFPSGNGPYSIACSDLNGDNKIDLSVCNLNNIAILLGTGNGNFVASASLAIDTCSEIINSDFNGDGKVDVAVSEFTTSSKVSVLLNCTPTPTCVASVTDSLFNISPLNWGILPSYSSQVTSAVWTWGDGTSTNALYLSHTYTTAGQYNICVTVYTSCGDSATACRNDSVYRMAGNNSMVNVNVMQNPNGLNQITNSNNQIKVYPNPASDNFTIETNSNEKQTIQVLDLNGRLIFSQNVSGKATIDASTLNEGVYNLTIKTAERVVNKKLVIVR